MLNNLKFKIAALAGHFSAERPERMIKNSWLFKTSSGLDRSFRQNNAIQVTQDDQFQYVTVMGRTFVWIKDAPIDGFLQCLSELLQSGHPHHYLWGNTKIQKGDYVLDIGSCEGGFAAVATEAGGHVTAIEPSRSNVRVIRRLFELWKLPQPQIVECLIGPECSMVHFEENLKNPGASRIIDVPTDRSYQLPVITLDELVERQKLPRVDFIKCDAEGQDVSIIRSGLESLKRFKPKIAVTTYHNDDDFADLYKLLSEIGYSIAGKGFMYSGGKLRGLMLHAW